MVIVQDAAVECTDDMTDQCPNASDLQYPVKKDSYLS